MITPTLATACAALPPEGAVSCLGRPGAAAAPTLATACAALPPKGAVSPWGGPAAKPSPTLATACAALPRSAGFTLLELLVVVAIVALVSAGVGFAMRDSSQVQLERDGERLAALLESARARSRVTGVPVRWVASASGFRFEGLAADALPQHWLDPDTGVASATGAATLLLGPEPIIGAQEVLLQSRSQPSRRLRLATDGVRPFAVQAAAAPP